MQPELGVMAGSDWVSWVSLTEISYSTSAGARLQTGTEVNIRSRLAASLINRSRHVQDCFPFHHSLFFIRFHRLDRKIQPSKNRARVEELLEAWPIPWIKCVNVWGAFLCPHIEICNCNHSLSRLQRVLTTNGLRQSLPHTSLQGFSPTTHRPVFLSLHRPKATILSLSFIIHPQRPLLPFHSNPFSVLLSVKTCSLPFPDPCQCFQSCWPQTAPASLRLTLPVCDTVGLLSPAGRAWGF